jgi:hypothetical protein
VQLSAVPNGGYLFNSWTGDCSGTNPLTFVNMNAPKYCTAIFMFCGSQPVRNFRTWLLYDSIQAAYDDNLNTLDGDTLQVLGTSSIEDPDFNRPISITLKGGYDCAFGGNGSYSFIHGLLTITSGTVAVENLVVK